MLISLVSIAIQVDTTTTAKNLNLMISETCLDGRKLWPLLSVVLFQISGNVMLKVLLGYSGSHGQTLSGAKMMVNI